MDQKLIDALDTLENTLEQVAPVPEMPRDGTLLEDLRLAFVELVESTHDQAERKDAACRVLALMGLYGALSEAITKCHAQLVQLDWKTLKQNFF